MSDLLLRAPFHALYTAFPPLHSGMRVSSFALAPVDELGPGSFGRSVAAAATAAATAAAALECDALVALFVPQTVRTHPQSAHAVSFK